MSNMTLNAIVASLAFSTLLGCDNGNKVQEERQDVTEQRQEAQKERAELQKEQQEEQRELANDNGANEPARDMAGTRGTGVEPMAAGRGAQDSTNRMAEMQQEQQKERAELKRENTQELREEKKDVAEAKKDVNQQRAEIMSNKSEKLRELKQRADELRQKQSGAEAENKQQVSAALANFPKQQKAIERDIEALKTVQAANLMRAEEQIENKLSRLEDTLEKADPGM